MAQVVLAFIVVAAAVFYILVKAPQTDAQTPASAAPVAEAQVAPASTPAASEPTAASVPAAASSVASGTSIPVAKP